MRDLVQSVEAPAPALRMTVVGCGQAGKCYVASSLAGNAFEVAGLVDTDVRRAETLRDKYGLEVPVSTTLEGLSNEVDLVAIATPPSTHLHLLEASLATGARAIVEKPPGGSASGLRRIAALALSQGDRRVLVAAQHVVRPLTRTLLELVGAAPPLWCRGQLVARRADGYFGDNNWRGRGEDHLLTNQGFHLLDLIIRICGPATEASAVSARLPRDVEVDTPDVLVASSRHVGGALASVQVALTGTSAFECTLELGWSDAMIVISIGAEQRILRAEGWIADLPQLEVAERLDRERRSPYGTGTMTLTHLELLDVATDMSADVVQTLLPGSLLPTMDYIQTLAQTFAIGHGS